LAGLRGLNKKKKKAPGWSKERGDIIRDTRTRISTVVGGDGLKTASLRRQGRGGGLRRLSSQGKRNWWGEPEKSVNYRVAFKRNRLVLNTNDALRNTPLTEVKGGPKGGGRVGLEGEEMGV